MHDVNDRPEPGHPRVVNTQAVGLGFGSLLIIAFLIIVFGRTNTRPLEEKIDALQSQVEALQEGIESANRRLEALTGAESPE